ncbi:hypothetical protein JOD20_001702 [Herpetosiphon giganteus]|nr:hypothetical protein [Herpetosiphon giganteus]MBM7843077.1 hypothetical protein [Herpetosiphon giganteus]
MPNGLGSFNTTLQRMQQALKSRINHMLKFLKTGVGSTALPLTSL